MSIDILGTLRELYLTSGIAMYASDPKALIMVAVACLLLYLAIVKKFEPLLLLPIAFGMLLTNLLGSDIYHEELFAGGHVNWGLFGGATLVNSANLADLSNLTINAAGAILTPSGSILGNITATLSEAVRLTETGAIVSQATGEVIYDSINVVLNSGCYLQNGQVFNALGELVATSGKTISAGLLDYLYLGVKLGIYPCLIFMGVGAGTDFGPLIANPKTLLLGAAAQLGIFLTFMGAILLGFTSAEAGAIGIIGGADGPTAIWLTGKLAPHLLGPIAVAAYSYMALVPVIQPPIMKALTTKKERSIVMEQLRPVSKKQKILFPIIVTILVALLLPSAAPLVGCLRRGGTPEQDCSERADEHRDHLPGCDGGRYGYFQHLPVRQYPQDHCAGHCGFRYGHGRRCAAGQGDEQALWRQDQSVDWFCRCFRSSHGGACVAEGRSGGQSWQLPADACHGPERGRRYRLCDCRGRAAVHVWLTAGFLTA